MKFWLLLACGLTVEVLSIPLWGGAFYSFIEWVHTPKPAKCFALDTVYIWRLEISTCGQWRHVNARGES
jgi:hypothetical protein